MKKNYPKLILTIVAVVLVFAALFVALGGPTIKFDKKIVHKVGAIDKNSAIYDDGGLVYYTSKGNIMCVDPYDAKNPSVWVEDKKLLAVNGEYILAFDESEVYVFNKQEKGIEESYSIKTNNAQVTEDALYYLDKKTSNIMKIDRQTREETVFLPYEVKKFAIRDNVFYYIPEGKGKGIIGYDLSGVSAVLYAQNKTVGDFYVTGDKLMYYFNSGSKQLNYIRLMDNLDGEVKGKKYSGVAACSGAFFYVKNNTLRADVTGLY